TGSPPARRATGRRRRAGTRPGPGTGRERPGGSWRRLGLHRSPSQFRTPIRLAQRLEQPRPWAVEAANPQVQAQEMRMHTANDHAVKVLNSLIETTMDSANGYKDAAEHVDNPQYKTMFAERSSKRMELTR